MNKQSALLLVDLQNDFCLGGSLAVPEGDQVIAVANVLTPQFETVIATQDWHPKNHMSFASMHVDKNVGDVAQLNGQSQILWPDHCVQNTSGAEFHPDLNTQCIAKIFQKGVNRNIDSYSAFYDNGRLKSTGLTNWLHQQNITTLYVIGLATDYCVKFSCLDAVADGFIVYCISDGCCGVGLQSQDVKNAIAEMKACGVKFIFSKGVILHTVIN